MPFNGPKNTLKTQCAKPSFFQGTVVMKSFVYGGVSALVLAGGSLFGPLCAGANAQVFSSQRSPQSQTQSQTQSQFPSQPGAPVPRNSQRTGQGTIQSSTTVQTAIAQDETLYLNKRQYLQLQLSRSQRCHPGRTAATRRYAIVRGQFEPAEGGLGVQGNLGRGGRSHLSGECVF